MSDISISSLKEQAGDVPLIASIEAQLQSRANKTTKDGKPFYVYKPLTIIEETDITKWEDDTLSLYQSDKYNYTYMKFIYWKLDKSCG